MRSDGTPPRLAEWLLGLCLPGVAVRDSVLGDLHELYAERERSLGRARARSWYWLHAARVGGGYLVRRRRGDAWARERPNTKTGGEGMRDLLRDARYALRGFVRTPVFLGVALATLALGVGANSAVFSVVSAVYLRPLDFAEPDRLVRIGQSALDGSWRMSTHTAGTYTDWSERQRAFEAFAGYRFWTSTVERDGVASRLSSVHSLGSIFDVLGVPAMLGRTFTGSEEGPGEENLVVLSHAFWQREFGDADPIGQALLLEGVPHEIIGVMPPTFRFPTPGTDVWETSDLGAEALLDRGDHFVNSLGRLAEGRTTEQAEEELALIHAELRAEHPDALANTTAEVVGLRDFLLGGVGTLWLTLMGAVGLVLLIACLNLANLLLSRAAARESEMAVRRALGASGQRLTRLVVVESVTLSTLGGLVGLGVGWLFLRGILAWMPGGVPRAEAIGFDAAVVGFTLAVTGLAALVFGLFPALQVSDQGLGSRMRSRGRGSTHVIRRGLVVGEVALAVVLVIAAGLTVRGFAAVSSLEPGFAFEGRTIVHVEVPTAEGEVARDLFFRDLEARLSELPGVRAVGTTSVFPMSGFTPGAWVGEPGVPVPTGDDNPTVRYVGVTPGFLAAAGVPLLRGRGLSPDDGREGSPALLLSESAAQRLFPGEEALGQSLYLGPDEIVAPVSTVVGIVGDVRQRGFAREAPDMAYVPRGNLSFWSGFDVVIDAERGGEALGADVRRIARGLDPNAIVLTPAPADQLVAGALTGQRNVMLLFSLLAGVALVMAVVGVFGVVAYLVSQRTREIGVRIAVGAARAEVQGLVLRQSLGPVALGAGLGTLAAMWLSRYMEGLLIGVEPTDLATFLAVPLLLLAVGAVASWLPARRAARLDPVSVLAAE